MLPRRAEGLLERAARQLAEARTPGEVVARAAGLVHDGARRGARRHPDARGGRRLPSDPLAASGLALWRGAGAPLRAVVRSRSRSEDPAPGRAELVVPLRAEHGSAALLVVGGRESGMPYTDAEERLLEGLRIVAATALGAAATAADLEARVREKTADLARGLRDRQRVLEAAKGICGAEDAEDVLARLAAFAGAEGGAPRLIADGGRGGHRSSAASRRPAARRDSSPSTASRPSGPASWRRSSTRSACSRGSPSRASASSPS